MTLLATTDRLRDEIGIRSAGVEEAPRLHALELCEAALGGDEVASRSALRSDLGLAEVTQLARGALATAG